MRSSPRLCELTGRTDSRVGRRFPAISATHYHGPLLPSGNCCHLAIAPRVGELVRVNSVPAPVAWCESLIDRSGTPFSFAGIRGIFAATNGDALLRHDRETTSHEFGNDLQEGD